MKFSLSLLVTLTVVIICNAMAKECTQEACDKECQDKGKEAGICALTGQGDVCQCSTKNKECTQASCDKECKDKGRDSGICGLTADGDLCQCKEP